MKQIKLLFTFLIALGFTIPLIAQPSNFETSLHKTREGKVYWYSTVDHGGTGGFETLTGVPIDDLGCVHCHDAADANGDPYPTDYEPNCVDCHATNSGTPGPVTEADCLGCHGRQGKIRSLGYTDVHRDAGMVCWDCHSSTDMHGDGNQFESMLFNGAITADCVDCHPSLPSSHDSNDPHNGALHCSSCHMQSTLSCYNCHFESMVDEHIKRAKQPIHDFVILVNREKDGKVHPATFQSLSYQGNTWVAMAPSYAHTITKVNARTCVDCHVNFGGTVDAINDFNDDGIMQFASWNSSDSTLSWLHGVVPLPADYMRSFKMDFIKYDGNLNDPPGPSKNWSFVKGEADGFQLFFGSALTLDQMNALGFNTDLVGVEDEELQPSEFVLEQNYPNPFNPSTTIKFSIPEKSTVELTVYNQLGELCETLVNEEKPAGTYEVQFNGQDLSSGIYFYQLKSNNFVSTKKFVLLK